MKWWEQCGYTYVYKYVYRCGKEGRWGGEVESLVFILFVGVKGMYIQQRERERETKREGGRERWQSPLSVVTHFSRSLAAHPHSHIHLIYWITYSILCSLTFPSPTCLLPLSPSFSVYCPTLSPLHARVHTSSSYMGCSTLCSSWQTA